ncbi:MAG: PEP-CTERM sorting domain-containing protein [Phycisphaerales bacterium]|nr:PEP-CTERM sorting domain-containing protein [Phycisphaerales bacterium]
MSKRCVVIVAGVVGLASMAQAEFIMNNGQSGQITVSSAPAAFPAKAAEGAIQTVVVDESAINVPAGLGNAAIFAPAAEFGNVGSDDSTPGVGTAVIPAPGALAGLGIAGLALARRRR